MSPDINAAKWLFVDAARRVCPGFVFRDEYKPIFTSLVYWCMGSAEGDLDPRKGLWLWGDIGTGKSTILEILSRVWPALSPLGRWGMRITNATDVCADYQSDGYQGLQPYIRWRVQAFDEVGSESIPTSHFSDRENVMQYILQRRYDNRGCITLATTNLSLSQISERYEPRIFDRCKQMFNTVALRGETFRRW